MVWVMEYGIGDGNDKRMEEWKNGRMQEHKKKGKNKNKNTKTKKEIENDVKIQQGNECVNSNSHLPFSTARATDSSCRCPMLKLSPPSETARAKPVATEAVVAASAGTVLVPVLVLVLATVAIVIAIRSSDAFNSTISKACMWGSKILYCIHTQYTITHTRHTTQHNPATATTTTTHLPYLIIRMLLEGIQVEA